tara:strand:- start:72 stop:422 length:351 start_codon:yes stop_codon:yes gene_type:complete
METNTIVLVLVSMCAGAALVAIASAYRSLKSKVNVTDYTIEKMEFENELQTKFDDLYNTIDNRVDNLMSEINNRQDDIDNVLDEIRGMIDNAEGRIDSRSDKLWAEIEKIEETLTK